ncbi:MAG TPA: FHA domain-containing protein [Anaerolineales bacterium]|nr:FHA domain-containing protein [Anaerolineales bacterium]
MAFSSGGVATGRLERAAPLPVKPPPGSLLNLHIIRTGQILPVGGVGEYIVGRISKGQSILPDVDLEPFHAFKSGVSRLHARIRVESQGMWITDLGSANGTQVNNEKLTPHQDYPLGNKDVVRLGRLSIQALVGRD